MLPWQQATQYHLPCEHLASVKTLYVGLWECRNNYLGQGSLGNDSLLRMVNLSVPSLLGSSTLKQILPLASSRVQMNQTQESPPNGSSKETVGALHLLRHA